MIDCQEKNAYYFGMTWNLVLQSFRLLRNDKKLMVFPVLSAIGAGALALPFLGTLFGLRLSDSLRLADGVRVSRYSSAGNRRTLSIMSVSQAHDLRVRQEAMAWLTVRTNDGSDAISTQDLNDFLFDGEPFLLKDRQQGIRKPAGFDAAFSIQTVYRADGQVRPYNDDVGSDGLLRYKWRGTDPNLYVNVALREAMNRKLPLIWFFLAKTTMRSIEACGIQCRSPASQREMEGGANSR